MQTVALEMLHVKSIICRLMVSLALVSVIRSNAHRTQRVRGSRTSDTCITIQKSEGATASSASMLATPMLWGKIVSGTCGAQQDFSSLRPYLEGGLSLGI